ncbi:MAG: hypothetical protein HRU09_06370 [Oligoflexales bacterium]|nr:hypothetical protein [Oligoflexales bacterium]
MNTQLLIASAVRFEVEPLLKLLQAHKIAHEYFEFGIGPINAAKNAVKLVDEARGRNLIYIGSAGTFSTFQSPYLCKADEVFWLPTAERMGLAKHMDFLHPPISVPQNAHFDLPVAKVLTSTSVSLKSDIVFENLPENELLVENMEAYAVLMDLLGIVKSIDVILGVTNGVGPEGSRQWALNF